FRFWNILKLRLFPIEIAGSESRKLTNTPQLAAELAKQRWDGQFSGNFFILGTKMLNSAQGRH
ncbi:MAG: hypothetical protein AABX52_02600, partial [Nanoarchaeota archaeon]